MSLFVVNLAIFVLVCGLCFNDLLNCVWIDSGGPGNSIVQSELWEHPARERQLQLISFSVF